MVYFDTVPPLLLALLCCLVPVSGSAAIALTPTQTDQVVPSINLSQSAVTWFSFPAMAGDVFRFDSGSFAEASGRTVADVFTNGGGAGASLAHAAGGGSGGGGDVEGARWVITFKAPAAQTYFLRVGTEPDDSGDAGGNFTLHYARIGRDVRATARGRLRIINNVVRFGTGERAIVSLAGGDPGGVVHLMLYTGSGQAMTQLPPVTLDASGSGTGEMTPKTFTVSEGGSRESVYFQPIGTGVYWIVASGALQDRQPVMIIATVKDQQ